MDEVPRAFAISDIPLEMKSRVYASCVRSSMSYGSETRPLLVEKLRRLVGAEPITTFIRSGRLRWYGHVMIQNPFLTAQSTQIKSVISVPIKDFIHHYPRALFNDIPRVGAHFNDIPGSGRTFMTYPGRGAV